MAEIIPIGEVAIAVTRKDIKYVHLSVHPPMGHVTLVAPIDTRPEVARAYAISKLGWIRDQQATLRRQARETPRQFVERESHYLWGRRYLLAVVEKDAKPFVSLSHRRITLTVRPGSTTAKPGESHSRMAQGAAARGSTPPSPEVGGQAGHRGCWLLSPAHENKVGVAAIVAPETSASIRSS